MSRLMILMALVMVFGFSAAGFAATSQQTCAVDQGYGAMTHVYTGRITSMNQAGNRVIVTGAKGDKSFDVSKALTNGGLQPNENVTVSYIERDDRLVALSVKMARPNKVSAALEKHFENEAAQQ